MGEARTCLHFSVNASTYLQIIDARGAGRRDPRVWVVRFGRRKNQSLFLFLPVRKCGFCSRGTTVFITQWKKVGLFARLLSLATIATLDQTPGDNASTYLLSRQLQALTCKKSWRARKSNRERRRRGRLRLWRRPPSPQSQPFPIPLRKIATTGCR